MWSARVYCWTSTAGKYRNTLASFLISERCIAAKRKTNCGLPKREYCQLFKCLLKTPSTVSQQKHTYTNTHSHNVYIGTLVHCIHTPRWSSVPGGNIYPPTNQQRHHCIPNAARFFLQKWWNKVGGNKWWFGRVYNNTAIARHKCPTVQ